MVLNNLTVIIIVYIDRVLVLKISRWLVSTQYKKYILLNKFSRLQQFRFLLAGWYFFIFIIANYKTLNQIKLLFFKVNCKNSKLI